MIQVYIITAASRRKLQIIEFSQLIMLIIRIKITKIVLIQSEKINTYQLNNTIL